MWGNVIAQTIVREVVSRAIIRSDVRSFKAASKWKGATLFCRLQNRRPSNADFQIADH
jgi:hypothetical protein